MQDFLQDTDGDLLIRNGDFVIGDSDKQNIADIIESYPGWWKEFPTVGVGIKDYLNSSGKVQELKSRIILQLQGDGFTVESPEVTELPDGNLQIKPNAYRKNQ